MSNSEEDYRNIFCLLVKVSSIVGAIPGGAQLHSPERRAMLCIHNEKRMRDGILERARG